MTYEVKTPLLKKVAGKMSMLMDNLEAGLIETDTAGKMIGAGNACTRAVTADLKVRLSAKALADIESPQQQAEAA